MADEENDILIEDIIKDDKKELKININGKELIIGKPKMIEMDKIMRYSIKQMEGITNPEEAPPEVELNIVSFIIFTLQKGSKYTREEIYTMLNEVDNYIDYVSIKKSVNDFVFSWQYESQIVKKK